MGGVCSEPSSSASTQHWLILQIFPQAHYASPFNEFTLVWVKVNHTGGRSFGRACTTLSSKGNEWKVAFSVEKHRGRSSRLIAAKEIQKGPWETEYVKIKDRVCFGFKHTKTVEMSWGYGSFTCMAVKKKFKNTFKKDY